MSADQLTISVRGEAYRMVAPDLALLTGSLSAVATGKREALDNAARALRSVTDALAALGGLPRTIEHERNDLTWSAYSSTTEPEHADDEATGRWRPTGRTTASVSLAVRVRALSALDAVQAALASEPRCEVHSTQWLIDDDNDAWSLVRADAIRAALAKARQYASALGGTISSIEQLADAGLLDSGEQSGAPAFVAARAAGQRPDTPGLDPVPQRVLALIDARCIATGCSLDAV